MGAASGRSEFWKNSLPLDFSVNLDEFVVPSKQGSSRGAASGESDFEKLHFLKNFVNFGEFVSAFQAVV